MLKCAVLVPILAFLLGCGAQNQRSQPTPTVTIARPVVKQIVEWDEFIGRMAAIDEVAVRARVSGYLKSIHFREGYLVDQGDLLFVIDPRPFEAALREAKANLAEAEAKVKESEAQLAAAEARKREAEARQELARRNFVRAKKLRERGATTEEQFDIRESELLQAEATVESRKAAIESAKATLATARASVHTAQADVRTAELELGYTKIRAPISGRIGRHQIDEGNLISGGTPQSSVLTTIVSQNPIHCYFDASEQEFLKYTRLALSGKRQSSREARNPVYLQLVDEEGYPHRGHMDFVDNRVDENTSTIRGRAIFRNPDDILTPGLFARVRLPGSAPYQAVLIPDEAIGFDQSVRFVLLVDQEDTVQRREVKLGPLVHGLRVVREGLQGEERIIIAGRQSARPGSQVQVETGEIEVKQSPLPNSYEPVPKEDWIRKREDEAYLTNEPPDEDGPMDALPRPPQPVSSSTRTSS